MSESLHKSDIALATSLRDNTPARVALTRTGSSISTRDALDFALAHAQARDAVHATLSLPSLIEALRTRNFDIITVKSAAPDRFTYLRRPDLGRTLSPQSPPHPTPRPPPLRPGARPPPPPPPRRAPPSPHAKLASPPHRHRRAGPRRH